MRVDYVSHMGSDVMIANAARVSFNKHHDVLDDSDVKLIRYLAAHEHWTPFAQTAVCLRVAAPLPVRTHCFKHKVGFVENEISRRYVDSEPSFYRPVWRRRAAEKKQGSGEPFAEGQQAFFTGYVDAWYELAIERYNRLLQLGAAPEQARMVLPQAMMTEWYWTGSLAAYARFYHLRSAPDTQAETRDLAALVAVPLAELFPVSWAALTDVHTR
jgi:thymidylate synthase (FAD)